ncbi:Acetyltransferase (GNAT) domain-containing protein [Micromonospora citrea]|uniref:Acetyltransferase (GNAT) domain-containing protein n=1 Tax=Micromonospora citrea TaxID=47855 RepID=A0A1C6VU33_9ACTN|nr:GNAT family N-acetyltransferase [Micromonospora citrea]SCL69858.1 Acetyltransferase (GNAT) domain-containing protein [Micromonospora citrea]
MALTVRAAAPRDAVPVAGLLRAAEPHLVVTPELLAWQATGKPAERFGMLVAEAGDGIAGVARTGLLHESAEPGLGFVNLVVRRERRGRGVGSALLAAAEERLAGLGVRRAYARVADEPAAVSFAERRGYRPGRRNLILRLDLTVALPAPPAAPPGVRLIAAADLPDPHPLYEADLDAAADEPGDVGMDEIDYADWRAAYWDRPDLDRRLTTVALVDDEVVAFSVALTDGGAAYLSGMTGTRREWRGRGLARLVKHASLRSARSAGHRQAFTVNDAGNDAMRAVNEWFGYQRVAAERRYLAELPRRPSSIA